MNLGMSNWRQQVREAASRAGLPRFWRWWIGELAPLVPSASRIAFQRRFKRPVIELRDAAVFWRPEFDNGSAHLAIAEQVSLNGDAAVVLASGRAAVARLAANASGGIAAPKVVVALDPKHVLRKELSLPAAVEENLMQTLAYDLDRHTPFRPEQLYFDAVVVNRDAARKMLRVDWAAALRTIVDEARQRVESWGAVPVAVVPGPPTASTRLNLIPEAARQRPLQWRRWQVWAPIAAVATFAIAAVIVPLAQKRQYAIALNLINAEAGQQAQAADRVRTQLEGMQSDYNYILAKKYAYPSAVHVIDEVTRVLPDDTWLTQLELKTSNRGKDLQRDIYLRGESGNAGKLVALLEDSKLVEQAAPRSPTTKIQGAPGEIFDLGARLRTVALPGPEPVALGSVSPAAAVAAQPPAVAPTPARASPPTKESAPVSAAPTPPVPSTASVPPQVAPAQAPVSPTTATGFGPFPNAPPVTAPSAMPPRAPRSGPLVAPQLAGQPAPRVVPVPNPAEAAPAAQPAPAAAPPGEPTTEVPPAPTMPGVQPAKPPTVAPQPVQPAAPQPAQVQPAPAQPAPQEPDED